MSGKPCQDAVVERVVEKLRSRSEAGLVKYGVTLQGSQISTIEWLTHLQEELLDAANYVQKLIDIHKAMQNLSE